MISKHQRFGQYLWNTLEKEKRDLFYIPDDDLIALIGRYGWARIVPVDVLDELKVLVESADTLPNEHGSSIFDGPGLPSDIRWAIEQELDRKRNDTTM